MEEAEALSDRIGIMTKGHLVTVGTARQLMEETKTSRFEEAFVKLASVEEVK
jgi:ABC-2 type transport system ATP-binding protein